VVDGTGSAARRPLLRLEVALLAFCVAALAIVAAARVGWIAIAGSLPLGLYPYYSLAAVGGWLSGNVLLLRSRSVRRRSSLGPLYILLYALAPAGPLWLVRAMAPTAVQAQAPLVPLYACAVFLIFFMVPWALRSVVPGAKPSDR
jgi:hypothetical protein